MRRGVTGVLLATLWAASTGAAVPRAAATPDGAAAPVTWGRQITLRHPGRIDFAFPATHLAFSWKGTEGSGISYRLVGGRAPTSKWRRAIEDHDAEIGLRHASVPLPAARSRAVLWRRVVPAGEWMGSAELGYVNTLDGRRELVAPTDAASEPLEERFGDPLVRTRAEWGADESIKRTRGSCVRRFFPVGQLLVHHTVTRNFDRHPDATIRAIYWFHVVQRGWCDLAYNFLIAPDGRIFEGRWARSYAPWETHSGENLAAEGVVGGHTRGFNAGSVGVSILGDYSRARLSAAARVSLEELLAWEADRHDLKPRGYHTYRNPETGATARLPYIAGHRDAGDTACPGRYVYRALPDIRRNVARIVAAGKTTPVVSLSSSSTLYRQPVEVVGQVTGEDGLGMAGRTVALFRRPAKTRQPWVLHAEAATELDGSFSFTLRTPIRNQVLHAVYSGDATTWSAQSNRARVWVSPVVTVVPQGASEDAGVYVYPPGTGEVALAGTVTPAHAGSQVVVTIEKAGPDGTFALVDAGRATIDDGGLFDYRFRAPAESRSGLYRATAMLPRHADHAAGASGPVSFVLSD